jgi:hypothetical protein
MLFCISGTTLHARRRKRSYALQRLLQKLPTQIDVGVLRFRQAREEVLDNRAIVSNLFERRLRIRTGLLLQRLNLVSDLLI